MDFEEIIRNRTAVRSFKNEKIKKEQLEKILQAGRLAPTAKNQQPQKIYVIESAEALDKINEVSPCIYGAQTVLLVCGDKEKAFSKEEHSTYEIDSCIVSTHMMLEATNVGVDNIWVEMFDSNKVKELFHITKEPICLIPLGYKDDNYPGNPMHNVRKELEETVEYL